MRYLLKFTAFERKQFPSVAFAAGRKFLSTGAATMFIFVTCFKWMPIEHS